MLFNLDHDKVGIERKLQLNELDKIRNDAYEFANSYKDRMKKVHHHCILRKSF